MIMHKETFRFSGHDTFHCKEQWLLKGAQLVEKQGVDHFKKPEAISDLGVGKNMVRSISHWLKSFGIVTSDNQLSEFANSLFTGTKFDPFLEKEGSLWLLQYHLCKSEYSTLFNLIFCDFFTDKATYEFSEFQILNYINRLLREKNLKEIAMKTLNSDFKVFIRTYVVPRKNEKTLEDDFNAPLLALNLISDTGNKNAANQTIYKLNKSIQESIRPELFGHILLDFFGDEKSVSYNQIHNSIGSYLCLSNEGLDIQINNLCNLFPDFVYKDDAGVKQLQIRNNTIEFKNQLLKSYYEI